jgi:hypothetical protein
MRQDIVEAAEGMVRDILNSSVHTAMPGKILSYDVETGLANVQPIGSYYCDRLEMEYPIIPSIPICVTANSDGIAMCMPIKAGDIVLLVCSEQSLSAFLSDTTEGQSNERFELTNCIAIPSLLKVPVDAQKEAIEEDAVIITNKDTKIIMRNDGIEVKGDTKAEGNIEITGNATINGKISITGDVLVTGNITATGNITGANTEG